MANSLNDASLIQEKLKELDQQYNKALHAGEKFSVLKDIRNKMNGIMLQLSADGSQVNGKDNLPPEISEVSGSA